MKFLKYSIIAGFHVNLQCIVMKSETCKVEKLAKIKQKNVTNILNERLLTYLNNNCNINPSSYELLLE